MSGVKARRRLLEGGDDGGETVAGFLDRMQQIAADAVEVNKGSADLKALGYLVAAPGDHHSYRPGYPSSGIATGPTP